MNFEEFLKWNFEEKIRLYCNKSLLNKYFDKSQEIDDWFNLNIIEKNKPLSKNIILNITLNKNLLHKDSNINDSNMNIFSLNIYYYDIHLNKILENTLEFNNENFKVFKDKFNKNFN